MNETEHLLGWLMANAADIDCDDPHSEAWRSTARATLNALLSSPACRAELLGALTENIASPVCSVSYCAGANGWGGPEYPTCDGCNSDGTISTLVTVAVDAALLVARTPEGGTDG